LGADTQIRPGRPGGGSACLDDAGQEQGEPAEGDVGADAVFEPVVDRAQAEDLFHVPSASLDLEEVLVAGAMSAADRWGSLEVRAGQTPAQLVALRWGTAPALLDFCSVKILGFASA
jgi:hypothetical protein